MTFGIYRSVANPPRGEHLDRCLDEVIAETQLAEGAGLMPASLASTTRIKTASPPSPLIVATAVAARTRCLIVGTSVILLPLHYPVHLAEDVIRLDLISKERAILGFGIGYQAAEFQAFGVPIGHRVALSEEGDDGVSNGEINHELAALKRMFNLALQQTPPNVPQNLYILMLQEQNVRKGFFEHDESVALRAALPSEVRPIVTFAYHTGWRKQESLGLTWNHVDIQTRTLCLDPGTTKNRDGRIIYLDGA
jgi:Luciferase-like monooxygenase